MRRPIIRITGQPALPKASTLHWGHVRSLGALVRGTYPQTPIHKHTFTPGLAHLCFKITLFSSGCVHIYPTKTLFQGDMHPSVHSSIIHNCQDTEAIRRVQRKRKRAGQSRKREIRGKRGWLAHEENQHSPFLTRSFSCPTSEKLSEGMVTELEVWNLVVLQL